LQSAGKSGPTFLEKLTDFRSSSLSNQTNTLADGCQIESDVLPPLERTPSLFRSHVGHREPAL